MFPGESSALSFPAIRVTFLTTLVLQILVLDATLLSPVLRLPFVENRSIRLERNAARGRVRLLHPPPYT